MARPSTRRIAWYTARYDAVRRQMSPATAMTVTLAGLMEGHKRILTFPVTKGDETQRQEALIQNGIRKINAKYNLIV